MTSLRLLLALTCLPDTHPAGRLEVYVDRMPSPEEVAQNDTGARFEPPWGCYLGAYIDLDRSLPRTERDEVGRVHRFPEDFEALAGKRHASYFFYMGYGVPLAKAWVAERGAEGRIVHIALEPNNGLAYVKSDDYLRELADDLRSTGAKVFLRFGSEMNGTWTPYSEDPDLYKEKFRLVAETMHDRAPNVAMVWAPYCSPVTNIPSFYPGDDVVDWVGVNMYNVTYFNQDPSTPGWQVHPCDMLDPVYRMYSDRKPIMIGEYGATHYSALEDEKKTEYAVRCIKSLYLALPRKYPRVKAINYFNGNNLDLSHAKNNNYAVTQDPDVLATYRAVVKQPYFLGHSDAPDEEPARPPVTPMPVRDGEPLMGRVRLSAWAKVNDEKPSARFLVNGKPLTGGGADGHWQRVLDTSAFPKGPAVLTVEAYGGGRMVSRKSVRVVFGSVAR